MDNPLFLESLKFGAGDGQLHYYLYNYRTASIAGGVDAKNNVDASRRGGVGVVMVSPESFLLTSKTRLISYDISFEAAYSAFRGIVPA